ncbi:MAG: purine-nucleoside phosphorylase [Treponema sp.]|jgi:purine-nucleoside phosphorylase|nr:purine-nucleoside phosphorylase [Treponema sp.]
MINLEKISEYADETAAFICGRAGPGPEIGLVLGSGLGPLGEKLEYPVVIPYGDIPHFVKSTAPDHKGRLITGRLGGKTVFCMQGRFHYYEGYSMAEITYPIRVMNRLGIKTLILTNACGGLNREFAPGDLLLITDHINFMGMNPLIGPNAAGFGPRFPDMSRVYTPALADCARSAARNLGITLREGVYLGYSGPSFETPAEIRLFQSFGASAVGMSTVPEAIVARHCGMKILALSCITNLAAGILDQPIRSEEVTEAAGRAGERFGRLLEEILRRIELS